MKDQSTYYPAKYPKKVDFRTALHLLQTENEQFITTNFDNYFSQLSLIDDRRQYFPSHVPSHLLPYSSPYHLFGAAFYTANSRQAYDRALVTFRARYGQELRQISGGRTFMLRITYFMLMYSLHPLPISAYHLFYFTYGASGKSTPILFRKLTPLWFKNRAPHNCYSLTPLTTYYCSLFWAILHEYQRKLV